MRWIAALGGAMLAISVNAAPPARERWIATWGSAQMPVAGDTGLPAEHAHDITLRQIVRLSAGGPRLRVRFANTFGTQPLAIDAASIGLSVAPGTSRVRQIAPLKFAGRPDAMIPAGAEIYADPVALAVPGGVDAAITLHLAEAPTTQTGHPGARATSFLAAGNHVADPDLPNATTVTRWFAIADVEVAAPSPAAGTVVAIGDSITDGFGVAPGRNTRWPDVLATRLRAAGRPIGVVNAGIGGNRVLLDSLGPNLMARFDRDVIARSGVRWAVLLEGVNDLGTLTRDAPATPAQHADLVARIIAAYRQVVARAHTHGIRVIGGTITPFAGNTYYHPDAATEADRQAINAFIRAPGSFDAVVDFDRVLRDPVHPDRLAAAHDSGDHLHPSEAGYRAMGDAVPLTLFGPAPPVDTRPAIALTFDDLPAHGPLPPGETRLSVVRRITTALATAKAPAFGFLNAGIGITEPTSAAAVAAWRAAGLPLGNHGYTHLNLDAVGAAAFTADLVRDEPPLAAAAGASDWHWFRYPFLAEGRDPAVRQAIRTTLADRGYRIAAVTMGFADYDWNAPYAACRAKHDTRAIARLESGYLADARTAALAARDAARAQTGRDVPQVLLLHVGAFGARMLPQILALYRKLGFRFVSLADAQADPFYATAVDPALPGPLPTLPSAPMVGPPKGLCV